MLRVVTAAPSLRNSRKSYCVLLFRRLNQRETVPNSLHALQLAAGQLVRNSMSGTTYLIGALKWCHYYYDFLCAQL